MNVIYQPKSKFRIYISGVGSGSEEKAVQIIYNNSDSEQGIKFYESYYVNICTTMLFLCFSLSLFPQENEGWIKKRKDVCLREAFSPT